ncbi:M16 family metallopeptidase [Sinomicrobium soli]|uniref:M16 family metallopeptidase n=1 Tax=Sinomicrobium sp. N-1-3-6 TaxID=2219864 RepID=UPI000DCC7A63|nr:M16 family metallopeptidase [Sinomicrobium sp. N-1-3-6]RAV30950.1 insulinase family protein [Sinomicrobium sp. N-1-3-6]
MRSIRIVFLLLLFAGLTGIANAQRNNDITNPGKELPFDPSVKTGKLENGLTYYIKKNTRAENRAELRLVVNAGSLLEDDDQQGLAHFVEHMAFNGTRNFEKNKLIDYLQSVGVEFGADLNAHTGFDETVYKLSVPTDKEDVFNTSLQVLRDWADGITFTGEEIDNERGVIAEELRARSGAGMRMYYQSVPVLTNHSRYADRLPIGTLDVILHSEYDAMRRYYRDWYRPDLQALVLVGDFDVEEIEAKIRKEFGSMKAPENPRERKVYQIPENKKPLAAVITDKETNDTRISIYYKREGEDVRTYEDYKASMLRTMYSGMLRQRLDEVAQSGDAPFIKAVAGIGLFLGNMDSYSLRADLKDARISDGIRALVAESERAKRFGFTPEELERYKSQMLANADFYKKEADKIPSRIYVERLIDHFTFEDPVVSEDFRYDFYEKTLPGISVDEVNAIAEQWITPSNIAIVLTAPEKIRDRLPSEKELIGLVSDSGKMELEPYKDDVAGLELMKNRPSPGILESRTYNKTVDVTTWKYKNGVTVMAKPTTFQNDIIAMNGFRPGGSSVAADSIYVSAREAGKIILESGLNGLSNTQLQKLNMGKNVSVTPYLNYYDELFRAQSNTAELERMFQMVHLYFTAPHKDEDSFGAYKERVKSMYEGAEDNPGTYFEEVISRTMLNNHLRAVPLTPEQIEKDLDLDTAYEFYRERFSNANGFTFIFAGNFDPDTIASLSEQYLASLPSDTAVQSNWKDIGQRRVKGRISKVVKKGVENKSEVDMRFTGTLEYTPEKARDLNLLAKVLKIRLTEELREKMSGVYGVRVSGFTTDRPYGWYRMQVRFTCAPENVEKLKARVLEEIDAIKEHGVSAENVNKIKKAEISHMEVSLKNDSFWISRLKRAYEYGLEMDGFLNYEEELEKLDSDYFRENAKKYFNDENYAEFILVPEKYEQ